MTYLFNLNFRIRDDKAFVLVNINQLKDNSAAYFITRTLQFIQR